jgi:hypothetical protein
MGDLLGYARVSTTEQNTHLQADALKAAGCIRVWIDTASVSKTAGEGVDERMFSDTAYGSGEGLFLDDHLWVVKNGRI